MRGAALAIVALLALASPARAGSIAGSALALQVTSPGEIPRVVLLQRAIVREWGPADDSTYREVVVPNWRSEGWAAALSAAVPGAGQIYTGEGSGWVYALAEAAGWTANLLFQSRAKDVAKDISAYAGSPFDASSAWSAQRWAAATGQDPSTITALYERDRNAYYSRIADDPVYGAGWKNPADDTRINFKEIRDRRERFLKRSRVSASLLWANHVVSALDALRLARNHNRPLQQDIQLKVGTRWEENGPEFTASLVRAF